VRAAVRPLSEPTSDALGAGSTGRRRASRLQRLALHPELLPLPLPAPPLLLPPPPSSWLPPKAQSSPMKPPCTITIREDWSKGFHSSLVV